MRISNLPHTILARLDNVNIRELIFITVVCKRCAADKDGDNKDVSKWLNHT